MPRMKAKTSPTVNGHTVCSVALTSSPEAVSWIKATITFAGVGRMTGGTFMLITCHTAKKAAPERTPIR